MSPSNEAVPAPKTPLYAPHIKAYPRFLNKGTFRQVKWVVMGILLAVFWGGSWLRWDRGPGAPNQAILIDMPGRRAYFTFIEIWPQEVYYLTGLLILAALGLFFISALWGRVWCGFTCFQTVFTDLFVWIEELFEGKRNVRKALDEAPWSANKIVRKSGKIAVWTLLSLAVGVGFVLYFDNAPTAFIEIVTAQASSTMYGTIALLAVFTFVMAGLAREQVCIYMCPYSRFQSAMFDEHSLIVSYEAWRGEPRGRLAGAAKGKPVEEAFADRGHCVDCTLCVQVCPTGIDIRDGSQLACIGCALCVDACNSVMDQLNLPRGLISYDSSLNQSHRSRGLAPVKPHPLRPRTLVYIAILSLVSAVMAYGLTSRKTFDINVLHERTPVYVQVSGNRIRNGYTFKILNMMRDETKFRVSIEDVDNISMTIIGEAAEDVRDMELTVAGDSVGTYHMFLTAPRASLTGKQMPLTVVLTDVATGKIVRHANIFAGPDM